MPEYKPLFTYSIDNNIFYELPTDDSKTSVFKTIEEALLGFANYLFESRPDIYSKYSKEDWEHKLSDATILDIGILVSSDIVPEEKLIRN